MLVLFCGGCNLWYIDMKESFQNHFIDYYFLDSFIPFSSCCHTGWGSLSFASGYLEFYCFVVSKIWSFIIGSSLKQLAKRWSVPKDTSNWSLVKYFMDVVLHIWYWVWIVPWIKGSYWLDGHCNHWCHHVGWTNS